MHSKFLNMVHDLPQLLTDKMKGNEIDGKSEATEVDENIPPSMKQSIQPSKDSKELGSRPAKSTPIYILANARDNIGEFSTTNTNAKKYYSDGEADDRTVDARSTAVGERGSKVNRSTKPHLPWSSPTLRTSPADQLVAAILDGDVQGIRTVVRSKGDDLRSEFWKDLCRSTLPLHRAVSGLHFHGSERLLVATIETLTQLGADVNATDNAGNSVLHKALSVCTSKSVVAVVKCLLSRGARVNVVNKENDTPLHSECKRWSTFNSFSIGIQI